ncbi:AAA family ATPase [Pseudoprimorskyibacter insulae]|uniref:Cyclic nucleotide-binding domain-containing protein n=1 Tax=Pseudoprimorskyibacter insulae TaxID=1695997 RepID=A0A2R8AY55_9RHOB|nr:AAA family ATPase [Pseudoprimorskyibacter insulae]SPF80963.1 hypothetical protein PRI8871_02777 [Pseudoprimorskyibacter insulae]
MASSSVQTNDPEAILACTISRDVQNFDLLIEDMEGILDERWGDLSFEDAFVFLSQPEADSLEFVSVALDSEDEENLTLIKQTIAAAKARDIKVILITEDVSPASLHQLLRTGADEFVPYPLPEGELAAAVERVRTEATPAARQPAVAAAPERHLSGDGAIIGVQGFAGGSGATTFAVNLAWELATIDKKNPPSVCLIDLGLQFGSVATYLDLPRKEAVFEMLTDMESLDEDSFRAVLDTYDERLHVLTAPPNILPLDIIESGDVDRLLGHAASMFDYVIVDMPSTLVNWSEVVLTKSAVYFGLIELDMRSAQNTLRMKRALEAEDLPFEKIRFLLNRAPKFTDLQGKSRVKRLADSLDIAIDVQLPDGGKTVLQACDHGLPLASEASKNPLRKEIHKLAESLFQIGQTESAAA